MSLTHELLIQLGAVPDLERGGLVLESTRFRAVFLRSSQRDGVWDVRVSPVPERSGALAFEVVTVSGLFHALFWTGRRVGEEDIRHKFRELMDVAESGLMNPESER